MPRGRRTALLALALAAVVVGLGALLGLRSRGEGGLVRGRASTSTTLVAPLAPDLPPTAPVTTPDGAAGGATPTSAPAGTGTTAGPPARPAPLAPTAAPAQLRLGGDDLGVTRVGAPFREAVAAVAGALGRPAGDPAPDSACIGAEEETSWEGFRLGSSGGRLSGWRSTTPALTTPAGVGVGTTLEALRRAYGAALQVRPPPEPDSAPVFVVAGAGIAGTLSGPGPADTVTSIFHGTCEAA